MGLKQDVDAEIVDTRRVLRASLEAQLSKRDVADLHELLLSEERNGGAIRRALKARGLDVSENTIRRWKREARESG